MQHKIIIKYYQFNNSNLKTYQYNLKLEDSNNSNINYLNDKQRDVQLDTLAFALKNNLPENSIITKVNNVDFNTNKQKLLEMLTNKDDFLSSILFESTETNDTVSSTETINASSNITDSTNGNNDNNGNNGNNGNKQLPHLVEYQSQNEHSYKKIDLNNTQLQDYDKIRKIGISKLTYVFNYIDLKSILNSKNEAIFTNPLGIIPTNGSVTTSRKHTFSKNAGFDQTYLDNSIITKIATITNTINQKSYDIYSFDPKEIKAKNVKPDKSEKSSNIQNNDLIELNKNIKILNDNIEIIKKNLKPVQQKSDLTDLPPQIVELINNRNETNLTDRAILLFNLIDQMSGDKQEIDPNLKSLLDPKLFLKAVNELSCLT